VASNAIQAGKAKVCVALSIGQKIGG